MSLELDGAILHISAATGERVFRVRLLSTIERKHDTGAAPHCGRQGRLPWRSAMVAGRGSGIA